MATLQLAGKLILNKHEIIDSKDNLKTVGGIATILNILV